MQTLRADRLSVREVSLFGPVLIAWLLNQSVFTAVEHVLNVLRVVLGLIVCKLLLVRKLDRACPIEELRCTVSGHVLDLGPTISKVLVLTATYAAVAQAWLT